MKQIYSWWCGVVLISGAGLTAAVRAQDFDDVRIEARAVGKGVYMLTGRGGNMGLSAGPDGALLIDDQFAPLTEKITAAVQGVCSTPIRFVINTHWHADHTGGNENLGKAGALIVAHENVRKRMSMEQFMKAFNRKVPASPPGALPVVTFTEAMTFHWNADEVLVLHVAPAHTDGDSMVYFRKANVLHTGDVFFNGMYPFIDVDSGGSIDGMIAAVDRALTLINQDTRVIPGHGPLSDANGLRAYRAMLKSVRDAIHAMIAKGLTREQIISAKPTAAHDAQWGGGFLTPDRWVGILIDGMNARSPQAGTKQP